MSGHRRRLSLGCALLSRGASCAELLYNRAVHYLKSMETNTTPVAPVIQKTPDILKIVGALMVLSGIGYFLLGIPTLLFFGLGIIFMILGGILMTFGVRVYQGKKNAYIGSMVIGLLTLLTELGSRRPLSLIIVLAFLYIIHTHKNSFVN